MKDRKKDFYNFEPISVKNIRDLITKTSTDVNNLYIMQERQCLPSFASRGKQKLEISDKKVDINFNIKEIEVEIDRISSYKIDENMKKTMRDYFSMELHKVLNEYRLIQQDFLKKVNCMEIFDGFESRQTLVHKEDLNQINEIKQTIFGLTTILMELKVAVGSQTWKLDRIEFFMSKVNENIKNSNRELACMPSKIILIKNRIIYILIFVVISLFILTIIKISKSRVYAYK